MASLITLRRYLPKTPTDALAFLFLLFCVNGVLFFELFVVLPFTYDGFHDSSFMYYTHIMAALFIYFNTVTNLVLVMITETGIRGLMLPSVLETATGWRFCSVCECSTPPRSHHCRICRTCVLKRDHHCTFTGCCIGHTNQRYFIVMILYIWIAALYATVMNIDFIYHVFGEFSLKAVFVLLLPILAWMFQVVETVTMTMAFMITLCLIGFLLSTAFLGYHMVNILHGQTMYEKTHKITNYNVGLLENLKSVFGKQWTICWLCPWIQSPLTNDGITFAQKMENEKDM